MMVDVEKYKEILGELSEGIQLIAVSKIKPVSAISEMYELGQKDFGENYVQELLEKQPLLPADIRWHFIGHLQSNKIKYIAPFVEMIQGVDSLKLLKEINRQAEKNNRVIRCLLQVHIAREETKFGFDEADLEKLFGEQFDELSSLKNIALSGMMGMATFTEHKEQVHAEYRQLKTLFDKYALLLKKRSPEDAAYSFTTLSIGMSDDYKIAREEGSTMVRIGSLIFGKR